MKAYCLASSSSGNCYILEFEIEGNCTRIMVECGLPYREILIRCNNYGIDLSSISCCLITHSHKDHSKAVKDMNRLNIPVFAHSATLSLLNAKGEELTDYKPKKVCEGIYVMSFPVEHDIDGALGFVIKTKSNETIIFINDHKRWTCNLSNFKPNYVFIECNYNHKVVYAQLNELKNQQKSGLLTDDEQKEVNIKVSQHTRNLNAHCSLNGTIKGLKKLNLKECHSIFLMHLSDRYANEYKMKSLVQLETGILTLVCGKNGGIK